MTRIIGRFGPLAAIPLLTMVVGQYRGGQLAQFLLLGASSAALAFVWGGAGVLSLGHSVPFGVGAYAGAWFSLHGGAAGSIVGVLVGAILGAAISFGAGLLGLKRRLDPVTFTLTTFVLALAAEQFANRWTGITGGFNGITDIPRLHVGTAVITAGLQRSISAFIAVACVLLLVKLAATPYGAALSAIRDNEKRSAALGYDVGAIKLGAFALAGAVTGLLGALYASQAQFVSPGLVGVGTATTFVVWVLLGSRTTLWGPVIATVVYSFGVTALAGRALNSWLLITGLAVIAVVLLAPEGLAALALRSTPEAWWRPSPIQVTLQALPTAVTDVRLEVNGVGARFGSFTALDDVHLVVNEPVIHCLIGPNGAGKSTLLDVLCGLTPHAGGTWHLDDVELTGRTPWSMSRAGVGRKFQAPSVATSATVAGNLALASWGRTHRSLALVRQPWRVEVSPECWRLVTAGQLDRRLHTPAGRLSHGERQMLELAMTLAAGCQILLLDEPTAGMTAAETSAVAALLRELCSDRGMPIVIVEHDMTFIREVADRVTVLRNGRVMLSGTVAEVEADEDVRAVYLGRAIGRES